MCQKERQKVNKHFKTQSITKFKEETYYEYNI